jgi:hypothetical protein
MALLVVLRALAGIAVIGLIGLYLAAVSAHRGGAIVAHSLTDAMRQKPRALVGHTQHAVQLMGAHALLAGAEKVNGQEPLMDRDMAALHHRARAARELVAAIVAEEVASLGLAFHAVDALRTAMRASDLIGPARSLQMGNRGFFVGELGGG